MRPTTACPRSIRSGYFVADGGLFSYGTDNIDLYRRAAGYVDRILRARSRPICRCRQPTKFELVINLKTAKALGLDVRRRCCYAPTR